MRTRKAMSLAATLATVGAAITGVAHADVTFNAPAAPLPVAPGSGLTGYYYGNNIVAGNLAAAQAYVNSHSPVATFTATSVNYGNSDSATLATFLGSDAASLSDPAIGGNTLTGQIIDFKGYYAVSAPGTQTLALGSDDGSELLINGTQVIDLDGDHSFEAGEETLHFTTAGLYQVEILYFEDEGQTSIGFLDATGAPIAASLLYPNLNAPTATPEPSPAFAIVLGVFAITGLGLRRRRSA